MAWPPAASTHWRTRVGHAVAGRGRAAQIGRQPSSITSPPLSRARSRPARRGRRGANDAPDRPGAERPARRRARRRGSRPRRSRAAFRISIVPNDSGRQRLRAMRGGGRDALQPQHRDRLARGAEGCEPGASARSDAGTCAAPETSRLSPAPPSWPGWRRDRRAAARQRASLSGRGITFSVTSVMTASVPQDPRAACRGRR